MSTITLTITWDGPGQPVQVSGPLQDKMLCYALLEMCKDSIRDFDLAKQSIIQPVTLVPPPLNNKSH
jgi:hypothetical protein